MKKKLVQLEMFTDYIVSSNHIDNQEDTNKSVPYNREEGQRIQAMMWPESTKEVKLYVNYRIDISLRIFDIMKEKNISVKELSKLTGKSQSTVRNWLVPINNFTIKTIATIEAALGEKLINVIEPKNN